jgi:hypothetical protein
MAQPTEVAIEIGRRQAKRVIEYRHERRRIRRDALGAAAPPSRARGLVREALAAELGPASTGVLLAEGDSWFDYPWTDVLEELEDRHGYDVEAVSHHGDTIEEMAYGEGQLGKFVKKLEKLIRRGTLPKAILLSGGGNDLAGDEFAMLLNHAGSAEPGLNEQVVSGLIDVRIRLAYVTWLTEVTSVCADQIGAPLPILVHGYDYSIPDGRGFWGGWGPLPGPWLEPGFRAKGYVPEEGAADPLKALRRDIVKQLIDRFNEMLQALPGVPGLDHVRHVNLRETLKTDETYKEWWANELHPTPRGFTAVAAKLAAALP